MAMIKCPECGQEVSDKAKSCIHCGCPLNIKNGCIKIKCDSWDMSPARVSIVDADTGETLLKISQNTVETLTITKDTNVIIRYPLIRSGEGMLEYEGCHNYNITIKNGLWAKLVLNEVTNIDSD